MSHFAFLLTHILGAIHACDLERFFQIAEWLKDPAISSLPTASAKYEAITNRFIEGAVDTSAEQQMKAIITPTVVQKYVLVINNFDNCPDAWRRLENHYDQYGEESLLRMNSMYGGFMKLNDFLKVTVIDRIEKGEIKSQSKYCTNCLCSCFNPGDIDRYSKVLPLRAQGIAALEKWYNQSELKDEQKDPVTFIVFSMFFNEHNMQTLTPNLS